MKYVFERGKSAYGKLNRQHLKIIFQYLSDRTTDADKGEFQLCTLFF